MEWAAESAKLPSPSFSSSPSPPSKTFQSSTSSLEDLSDTSATNFNLLQQLGRGAFATCYLATSTDSSQYVAIKHFHTPLNELDPKLEQSVHAEVESLKLLSSHVNVTTYHGFFLEPSSFSLVVEFCESGTLSELIDEHHTNNLFIPEPQLWEILVQCLDALRHVHSLKIIHRDLKPENILLQGTHKRLVKLCDFGVSSLSQTMASTTIGTPYYLAPELCEGEMYGSSADMWSFGCVCYELMALERPFHGESLGMLVRNIMKNQPKELPSTHFSPALREVASAFLVLEPHLRPSADVVLSWKTVGDHHCQFQLICQALEVQAGQEAQHKAKEWHASASASASSSAQYPKGETKAGSTAVTARTKGALCANRTLVQHSRVWRFGSGQSAPKIVESMLQYDISMVSLGGIDTITNDTGNATSEDREEEDDYDDECNEWDTTANGTLSSFALCVDRNGNVFTFGETAWESSFTSRLPRAMSDDGVTNISCGTDYCLAIDCLGRVWLWGQVDWLALAEEEDSGNHNSFASTGSNANPFSSTTSLATSTTSTTSTSSTSESVPMLLGEFGLQTRAKQVACGEEHLCVLDVLGNVWTAGDNSACATGHGEDNEDEIREPQQLTALESIVAVACGATCCLALEKGTGAVYMWGTLSECDPVPVPTQVKEGLQDHDIVQIDAGRQHCAAITSESMLFTWGENSRGECGQGHFDSCVVAPTLVREFDDEGDLVRKVSCGARHTAAVTSGTSKLGLLVGVVQCFGCWSG